MNLWTFFLCRKWFQTAMTITHRLDQIIIVVLHLWVRRTYHNNCLNIVTEAAPDAMLQSTDGTYSRKCNNKCNNSSFSGMFWILGRFCVHLSNSELIPERWHQNQLSTENIRAMRLFFPLMGMDIGSHTWCNNLSKVNYLLKLRECCLIKYCHKWIKCESMPDPLGCSCLLCLSSLPIVSLLPYSHPFLSL